MLVNSYNNFFGFSVFEKGAQFTQNLALNALDRIYPINPYTKQRELAEPAWINSYFKLLIKPLEEKRGKIVEWPNRGVRFHTWKYQGSDQHFSFNGLPPSLTNKTNEAFAKAFQHDANREKYFIEAQKHASFANSLKGMLGIPNPYSENYNLYKKEEAESNKTFKNNTKSYYRVNIDFETVVHGVFERIRKYVDQIAQDSHATRYQFNYQFKILDDVGMFAHTYCQGKIEIDGTHLHLIDKSSFTVPGYESLTPYYFVKGYEFLSFEEKFAATLAHEFAHNCLGHTQAFNSLLRIFPRLVFPLVCSLVCLFYLTDLSALYRTYNLMSSIKATEMPRFVCRLFWALKGVAITPLCLKVSDFFMSYVLNFWRRQEERDADTYAIELLYQSGFDIRSAQYLMQFFINLEDTESNSEKDSYWWSTSTHPSHAERLNHVTQIVENYYKKYGHYKKP